MNVASSGETRIPNGSAHFPEQDIADIAAAGSFDTLKLRMPAHEKMGLRNGQSRKRRFIQTLSADNKSAVNIADLMNELVHPLRRAHIFDDAVVKVDTVVGHVDKGALEISHLP